MKVINPNNTTHEISLIPRFYPTQVITLELYNEVTQEFTEVPNIYLVQNGIMYISFDFTFNNKDKYQIKIKELDTVIFRSKLVSTDQVPQNYKITKDIFYYE